MYFPALLRTAFLLLGLSFTSSAHPLSNAELSEQNALPRAASNGSYRFLNKNTSQYLIKSLPVISNFYDIGEMYSGLIPVYNNLSRALFYVFQPTVGTPVDEVTIWFNGGPGCSSLNGFLQENGLFRWLPGQSRPTSNPYSWVNLTNMLWIEQPVTTGFSQGKPNATNEVDIASDVIAWFKNFQDIFGISNYKIYVTGESYAGRYVPYVSGAMLDQKNTKYYDLKGALMYDPVIGDFDNENNIAAVQFVQQNSQLFNLDPDAMASLDALQKSCQFTDYIDKYLSYPPPGNQPPDFSSSHPKSQCVNLYYDIIEDLYEKNPCFNEYEITQNCPVPSTVLPQEGSAYFNRTDVKMAMHAPLTTDWMECGGTLRGDTSPDPIRGVLPQVIEGTNRVLVSNGDYDYVLITNGTLLAIQNMTWNGKLGFQEKPSTPINITLPPEVITPPQTGGQGIMGIQHYERGLMWAETYQSGHMQPEYQNRVAYTHLQWLLGRINTL